MSPTELTEVKINFVMDTSKLQDISLNFVSDTGFVPLLNSMDLGLLFTEAMGNANLEDLLVHFLPTPSPRLQKIAAVSKLTHERSLDDFDDIRIIRDDSYSPLQAVLIMELKDGNAEVQLNGSTQETITAGSDFKLYTSVINLSGELPVLSLTGSATLRTFTLVLR